jgi:predicted glycosyltransferase
MLSFFNPLQRLEISPSGDQVWPGASVLNKHASKRSNRARTDQDDVRSVSHVALSTLDRPIRRIALYSHDTQGLGHLRRNLVIARALSQLETNPTVLMICGAREIGSFSLPDRVDCVTLPAIHKGVCGSYRSRDLDLDTPDLTRLRSNTISSALESFAPDLLIVDKVPEGVMGELRPALQALRRAGRTRCVLGLRDVLDEPHVVQREWTEGHYARAIESYFDEVWIYGDPDVYDVVVECSLQGAVSSKSRSLGYLHPWALSEPLGKDGLNEMNDLNLPNGPTALCLVGGGQDGGALANAFISARAPLGMNRVLVTGPFMPTLSRDSLRQQVQHLDRVAMLDFISDPRGLMTMADRIISMGGYNSMCEVVASGVPALIVPRVTPRLEQLIRAARFRTLGLVDMIHPSMLSSSAIETWLAKPCTPPHKDNLDFSGLDRLASRVRAMRSQTPDSETACA